MLSCPQRPKLVKGMDVLWERGRGLVRRLLTSRRRLLARARRIAAMEQPIAAMGERALDAALADLRDTFRLGRDRSADVDRAFALVREAARRELGLLPFVEQIAAGLVIHGGGVAEMATGEGKTLAATLPAAIAGWRGRGCHIITVNDYLARRDAEWMGPLYKRCGLRVGWVEQEMTPPQRRAAYAADVTYLTNKEAAADMLRDRLATGRQRDLASILLDRIAPGSGFPGSGPPGSSAPDMAGLGSSRTGSAGFDGVVMRGLACAIVDEVDSVLIDEAVTPLIIASQTPNEQLAEACRTAAALARDLEPGRHYRVDHRYREINLTRAGRAALAGAAAGLDGLWHGARRREELVNQALCARELYLRGKHYIIAEGKVVIVDEFTGRLMPDRSWRDGMHQAVEAKEGLEITPLKETQARISFQNFFRLYQRLGGMSGTAAEAWGELWQIYQLPVVTIPTHRPCIRRRWPDRVFATAAARWDAVVEQVREVHATGRPILIGTRSVEASEYLSTRLTAAGIEHRVLNAIHHEQEAAIIAGAGEAGSVMVATNMAGRGTDIKLTPESRRLGGLHVIATERHEAARIDRQLFGRAGRQGDPGSAIMFASLEDELVRRYARPTDRWRGRSPRHLTRLQRRAQRLATQQRKAVLRNDDWLAENLGFAGRE